MAKQSDLAPDKTYADSGQVTHGIAGRPASTRTSSNVPGENVNHARDKANNVPDEESGNNGNGNGSGYGGYGGSGANTPEKKNWSTSDITSNPGASDQYYNPDAAAQQAALQGAANVNPADMLAGTEGMVPTTDQTMGKVDDYLQGAGIGGKDFYEGAGIDGDVNLDRINHIDISEEEAMLNQLTDAQRQQAILQSDHTVNNGISELQRSLEDSQENFNTQRNQIDADEARAKDNQVLYNEARGDRGGIGQAQYDSVMNTAATNRYTVQKEQAKVAQDVQRQIATLRANGEFEKANKLLSISQQQLSQLMQLHQWAKETNLGIDEFNSQLQQWEENYKMQLLDAEINVENFRWNTFQTMQSAALSQLNAQLGIAQAAQQAGLNNLNAQLNIAQATGAWADGTPTWQARQEAIKQLADSGNALLQAGIAPSAEQLTAMGLTPEQAIQYLKKYFPYG